MACHMALAICKACKRARVRRTYTRKPAHAGRGYAPFGTVCPACNATTSPLKQALLPAAS